MTLRYIWVGDITPIWHPSGYETFSQGNVFPLIFNFLVKSKWEADGTITIVPDLADTWEISPDARTFTFRLHEGIKWHDGEPFTSSDVVFTATRQLINPFRFTQQPWLSLEGADEVAAGTATELAGISAPDSNTVVFTLKEPNVEWLRSLTDPNAVILPEHVLKDTNPADVETIPFSTTSPIGTGPYKFVKWEVDQFIEFEANPDYFKGAPKIDRIFNLRSKADAATALLEAGDADLGLRLAGGDLDRLSANENLDAVLVPNVGQTSLQINVSRLPDKRVQQALWYAIDRQGIVDAVFSGERAVTSFVFPGFREYDDLNKYEFDPAKAKELLAAAAADGTFDPNMSVRLVYDLSFADVEAYAPIIQNQLQAVGLNVELQPGDSAAIIDLYTNRPDEWEISFGQGGDQGLSPDRTANYYDCAGNALPGDVRKYKNCDMDALFVQARTTGDLAARDEIYHQIARILNEEVAGVIPLWRPALLHAASKKFGGLTIPPNTREWAYFIENVTLAP